MKEKKIISCLIALILLLSSYPGYAQPEYATRGMVADMLMVAADFYNTDIKRSDILRGYEDGQLHEERFVTRAEALVMLSRAFENIPEPVGHNARVALVAEDFTDIPLWAHDELQDVFDGGLVAGTAPGLFSANEYVTKSQMQLFIQRAYSLFGTNLKDDFYATVNKDILETLEIYPWNASAGTVESLQIQASDDLYSIISDIIGGNHPDGAMKQKIADFYLSATDMEKRNKDGIKPIKPYLEKIDSVKNIGELTLLHSQLAQEICLEPFVEFGLAVDLEDSSKYNLCFSVYSPILPKNIYMKEDEKVKTYIDYLTEILVLSGEDEETAATGAKKFFEFEKLLASTMLSPDEADDLERIYNLYSYNKICSLFPDFDMNSILEARGFTSCDKIIVSDKNLVDSFSKIYNQFHLDELKLAMKISILHTFATTLNEDFLIARQKLSKGILGIEESRTVEQTAFSDIISIMPEYIGEIYAEEFFDEESKKEVEEMTRDIIRVFKNRIESNTWMSEQTKAKAIQKLDSIKIKVGYPENGTSYVDDVDIVSPKRGGTYFANLIEIAKASKEYVAMLQNKETDRDMWAISPYEVNAAYNVNMNDITISAAILQSPLYDKNFSYEENLGGIGYVIAHEITHAFDVTGSRFDENGNMLNWWTVEDEQAYKKLCQSVISHFDGCEAIPAIQNNGELTLNENIADLGAVACITQLAAEYDGFDYKDMYKAVARVWISTSSREFAEYLAENDTHSNGKLRVNRVLVNFDEFHEAFGIKEGDGMYLEEDKRVLIW